MEEAILQALKSFNRSQWINVVTQIVCCLIWASLVLLVIPRVVRSSVNQSINDALNGTYNISSTSHAVHIDQ